MNTNGQHIVLISKDVLRLDYLPIYGNKYYYTPNIDELAVKGTVFMRHYTAAPSTAMAFTSMFTGKYPYQTGRKDYTEIKQFDIDGATTLFDELYDRGYTCHLMWSDNYKKMAERFSRCYGDHTIHHENLKLNQYVGAHLGNAGDIKRNDEETENVFSEMMKEIDSIDTSTPVFLWVHLPHVLRGRTGYGDDIDLLDRFVGEIRKRFGDYIILTADHGSNNGKNGKTGYGFDVYESCIHIPLITPRIEEHETYEQLTSNIDLTQIILNGVIPNHDYVISDTAYYEQPHRKIAIIKDNYKFVYDKKNDKKSLFDVEYDRDENIDLAAKIMKDTDRNRNVVTRQVLFYPFWDAANREYEYLDKLFNEIWVQGSFIANNKNKMLNCLKSIHMKRNELKRYFQRKK